VQGFFKDGRKLQPDDIDKMEDEIFKRMSNMTTNIALDQF